LKTENPKWLFVAALVFGIGFLNKYNIIFLVIGLLPAILLTRVRNVFTKKELYLALVLGLLIITPNLIWQYKNDFPVFYHLKELSDTQLVHVDRLDFLKSQLLFFAGSILVILSAIYALLFYKPFGKYRIFLGAIFFTILIFLYFRAKGYYAMGLYPIYISFGSVFLANMLRNWWGKIVKSVLMIIPMLFFILLFFVAFPNKSPEYIVNNTQMYQKSGMLRWEDGKEHALPQDFADMLGWKKLALMVDSICAELPNLDNTFILCDNYGQAGAINYYTKNKKVVAHSYHADYINWIRLDRPVTDVVLVKEALYDKDMDRKKETPFFETVYLAGQRINQYAREDTISIYVLKNAKIDVNQVIKDEIDQRRNENRQ
jgi:hypothetical protein